MSFVSPFYPVTSWLSARAVSLAHTASQMWGSTKNEEARMLATIVCVCECRGNFWVVNRFISYTIKGTVSKCVPKGQCLFPFWDGGLLSSLSCLLGWVEFKGGMGNPG